MEKKKPTTYQKNSTRIMSDNTELEATVTNRKQRDVYFLKIIVHKNPNGHTQLCISPRISKYRKQKIFIKI